MATCRNGRHTRTATNHTTHPTTGTPYCMDCTRERATSTMYARRNAEPAQVPSDWRTAAACQGEDLVLFFGPDGERQPEREARERKAKEICAQCAAVAPCLEDALAMGDRDGVRGGLGADELVAERRHRRSGRSAA